MTGKAPKEVMIRPGAPQDYAALLSGVSRLLDQARYAAARSGNAILTATYWEIGHRILPHLSAPSSNSPITDWRIKERSCANTVTFLRKWAQGALKGEENQIREGRR
jgi:hypothetical protein